MGNTPIHGALAEYWRVVDREGREPESPDDFRQMLSRQDAEDAALATSRQITPSPATLTELQTTTQEATCPR